MCVLTDGAHDAGVAGRDGLLVDVQKTQVLQEGVGHAGVQLLALDERVGHRHGLRVASDASCTRTKKIVNSLRRADTESSSGATLTHSTPPLLTAGSALRTAAAVRKPRDHNDKPGSETSLTIATSRVCKETSDCRFLTAERSRNGCSLALPEVYVS